jgi:hypothetical protein
MQLEDFKYMNKDEMFDMFDEMEGWYVW